MKLIKSIMEFPQFTKCWSILALTTVIVASVMSGAPLLVSVGSVIGILYVLGAAFGWSHANLWGALLAAIFGYLSYTQGFYGNAAINLLYSLPVSAYGLWLWRKNSDNGQLTVKRSLSDSKKKIVSGVTLVAIAGSCAFSMFSGSNLWYLDGISAVLPILGTWFLVNMYKEQWYYWLTYNALEVVMWFTVLSSAPEMLAIFVMRIVFFINSIFGFANWNEDKGMSNANTN